MANRKSVKLLVEERRRRILELLDKEERATVEELSDRFDVSSVTIRGDLDTLADAGAIVRSHGGALKRLDQQDTPIAVKETLHHGEKVRIGHAAAGLIRQGETIILDSGTTTAEIARQLRFLKLKSLTVITNALNIAMELANLPHIRVIMIGGILRQMSVLDRRAAGRADPARPQCRSAVSRRRRARPRHRADDPGRARGAAQWTDDQGLARSDGRG